MLNFIIGNLVGRGTFC